MLLFTAVLSAVFLPSCVGQDCATSAWWSLAGQFGDRKVGNDYHHTHHTHEAEALFQLFEERFDEQDGDGFASRNTGTCSILLSVMRCWWKFH